MALDSGPTGGGSDDSTEDVDNTTGTESTQETGTGGVSAGPGSDTDPTAPQDGGGTTSPTNNQDSESTQTTDPTGSSTESGGDSTTDSGSGSSGGVSAGPGSDSPTTEPQDSAGDAGDSPTSNDSTGTAPSPGTAEDSPPVAGPPVTRDPDTGEVEDPIDRSYYDNAEATGPRDLVSPGPEDELTQDAISKVEASNVDEARSQVAEQTGLQPGEDFVVRRDGDQFVYEYTDGYQRELAAQQYDDDINSAVIEPDDVQQEEVAQNGQTRVSWTLTDSASDRVGEAEFARELGVSRDDIDVTETGGVVPTSDTGAKALAEYQAQQSNPEAGDVTVSEVSPGVFQAAPSGTETQSGEAVGPTDPVVVASPDGQEFIAASSEYNNVREEMTAIAGTNERIEAGQAARAEAERRTEQMRSDFERGSLGDTQEIREEQVAQRLSEEYGFEVTENDVDVARENGETLIRVDSDVAQAGALAQEAERTNPGLDVRRTGEGEFDVTVTQDDGAPVREAAAGAVEEQLDQTVRSEDRSSAGVQDRWDIDWSFGLFGDGDEVEQFVDAGVDASRDVTNAAGETVEEYAGSTAGGLSRGAVSLVTTPGRLPGVALEAAEGGAAALRGPDQAREVTNVGVNRVGQATSYYVQNPAEGSTMLAGSLLASYGITSTASRIGGTSGSAAARYAIQPGEEVARAAGARALGVGRTSSSPTATGGADSVSVRQSVRDRAGRVRDAASKRGPKVTAERDADAPLLTVGDDALPSFRRPSTTELQNRVAGRATDVGVWAKNAFDRAPSSPAGAGTAVGRAAGAAGDRVRFRAELERLRLQQAGRNAGERVGTAVSEGSAAAGQTLGRLAGDAGDAAVFRGEMERLRLQRAGQRVSEATERASRRVGEAGAAVGRLLDGSDVSLDSVSSVPLAIYRSPGRLSSTTGRRVGQFGQTVGDSTSTAVQRVASGGEQLGVRTGAFVDGARTRAEFEKRRLERGLNQYGEFAGRRAGGVGPRLGEGGERLGQRIASVDLESDRGARLGQRIGSAAAGAESGLMRVLRYGDEPERLGQDLGSAAVRVGEFGQRAGERVGETVSGARDYTIRIGDGEAESEARSEGDAAGLDVFDSESGEFRVEDDGGQADGSVESDGDSETTVESDDESGDDTGGLRFEKEDSAVRSGSQLLRQRSESRSEVETRTESERTGTFREAAETDVSSQPAYEVPAPPGDDRLTQYIGETETGPVESDVRVVEGGAADVESTAIREQAEAAEVTDVAEVAAVDAETEVVAEEAGQPEAVAMDVEDGVDEGLRVGQRTEAAVDEMERVHIAALRARPEGRTAVESMGEGPDSSTNQRPESEFLDTSSFGSDNVLSPGWLSESVTAIATLGRSSSGKPSQSELEARPFEEKLTGELPTQEMLSGDQETQERIADVQSLLGGTDTFGDSSTDWRWF